MSEIDDKKVTILAEDEPSPNKATTTKDLEATSNWIDSSDSSLDIPPPKKHHKHPNFEEEEEEFDLEKYPVRQVEFIPQGFKEAIAFNPVVSGIAIVFLWGLAIWSIVDSDGSNEILVDWRGRTTYKFTWLFVGMRAAFFLFLVYTAFKFGHVKLGHQDEDPEFDTGSYFAMIFAAGMAVGLFVYGVSEPLYHLDSNFYSNAGYHSQDELSMWAINMTVTNSAIAGWAPYLIVAVAMGLAGHRYGLPLTFRSCFYPIFGQYTWGWIGDVLDGYAIVVTVSGVCTSLGIGAIQVVAGFQYLGWVDENISEDRITMIQNLTIWGITAIATASVISGVHAGVKFLSQFAFMLGLLLLFLVFIMDDTKFIMNLFVQECGYFMQHSFLEMNFWTDAFAQLREGSGRATDGKAGSETWMNDWVIFYQAWWCTAWACFVGLFVARISRGRTVFEVIAYSMIAPILYCMFWFCTWGGAGMRQARQAAELAELGSAYFEDKDHFLVDDGRDCYDVPQENVYVEGVLVFENRLIGVTPVCGFGNPSYAPYNLLYSFSYPNTFDGEGYGPILTVLFIIGLAIYFATSSDSGSLVVDHLASNGRKKHHWIQRLFWAVTEGALATSLLSAGGSKALGAVQAGSIIGGLPFAVMLLYIMQTIYQLGTHALENPDSYEFSVDVKSFKREFTFPIYGGIFNTLEWIFSGGKVNHKRIEANMDNVSGVQLVEFMKALFVPGLPLWQTLNAAYPKNTKTNILAVGAYSIMFYCWIIIFCASAAYDGLQPCGWVFFFGSATLLTTIRSGFRTRYSIRSNIVGDFVSSLVLWPQVLSQLLLECFDLGLPDPSKEED